MALQAATTLDLTGQVAIVTGAAQGLGRAMAAELATAGASVVLADVQAAKVTEACETLAADGLAVSALVLDITDSAAVADSFQATVGSLGRLDVVVNNAGLGQQLDRISDLSDDEWGRVIAVTLTGTFYCCRAAAAIMEQQESGTIINISSINGQNPAALAAAYNVAKAGVISLTRTLALEMAAYGVRVNAVCPGDVITPMLEGEARAIGMKPEDMYAQSVAGTPLGRIGVPEDISGAILFLASDASSLMSGAGIVLDGGASV